MPVQDIEGPKMLPPLMGLIPNSVVPETDTSPAPRWAVQSGIEWRSRGCGDDVEIFLTCPAEPSSLPDTNDVELNEAKAFWPLAPASCLAVGISVEELRADAREKLAACESAKIEAELWTGALTENPHFGSEAATEVGSGFATVGAAISALENALADCGCGSQGMIHMRRGLADALHGAGILRRIDEAGGRTSPRLETAAGTIVVAGAGYPGTGPAGEAVGATEWIYATGKIAVKLGGIIDMPNSESQALNRETNIETFFATRAALALFDPCCLLAAEVPAGDGGAGDTGDATAGNQVIGNETLESIDGHVDGLEEGQTAGNASLTAIAGSVDGLEAGVGAPADAATPTGNGSLIGLVKAVRDFFKKEDDPHVSGDYGMPVWGIRNDNLGSNLTSANLDYGAVAVAATGGLMIEVASSVSSPFRSEDAAISSGSGMAVVGGQRQDVDADQTSAAGDAGFLIQDRRGHTLTAQRGSFSHISTSTTTAVKATPGTLRKVVVNTGGASHVATVYDNTAGSGTIVAVIDCAASRELEYNAFCATGITVVTAGGTPADITIVYA